MREIPILFSTPMVQAILKGRKTQTRRVIKNLPPETYSIAQIGKSTFEATWGFCENGICVDGAKEIKSPYQPGDILWVRETWAKLNRNYRPDDNGNIFVYKADHITGNDGPDIIKWRPSIHMPKQAARIFLRVTNIRVERLQNITEEDAKAEGAKAYGQNNCSGTSARIAFAELWDSIYDNPKQNAGWRQNPWLWVVEFERVKP